MTEEKLNQAKKNFKILCSALEDQDWTYQKDEDNLRINCGARGDDLPMDIIVEIDAERQLSVLLSHLPFVVAEDKRVNVAVAISVINYQLVDGSFDFDINDGHLFFRMTSSFIESDLDKEVFAYMLMCSCVTIDMYNDKLFMIAKGMLSVEDFIKDETK